MPQYLVIKSHIHLKLLIPTTIESKWFEYLVRDFSLTKKNRSSYLQDWNNGICCRKESTALIFVPNTKVFKISVQNNVRYCSNIDGLFEALESEQRFNEWRLLIDLSKASLKAVLLNNENEKPSIPLVHALHWKKATKPWS